MLEILILLAILLFMFTCFGIKACLLILAALVCFFLLGLILAGLSKILFFFTGLLSRSDSVISYLSLIFLILLGIWTKITLFIWISIFAGILLTIQLVFKTSVEKDEYYKENNLSSQSDKKSSRFSTLEKIAVFLGLAWLFSNNNNKDDYAHTHNLDNQKDDEKDEFDNSENHEESSASETLETSENTNIEYNEDSYGDDN